MRGYGLVDSPKQRAEPGTTLNLRATPAPSVRAAAEYYPAGYWYSLLRVPAESEFPGTGPEGNGINPNFKTQAEYVRPLKNGAEPSPADLERCSGSWRHALHAGAPRPIVD